MLGDEQRRVAEGVLARGEARAAPGRRDEVPIVRGAGLPQRALHELGRDPPRRFGHRETLDVRRIYDHLTREIGFRDVGFAPVTSAPGRSYAFEDEGFDRVLAAFRDLAADYRDAALANRHHGFSNVRETLEEIHKGASKAWPCGAGFGLLGVSTAGDVALCHRFAGSDDHRLGSVREGIDREAQRG